jgi:hypothetical protein
MKGAIKVWLWDFDLKKYCLLYKEIELSTVPSKGAELRIKFISKTVHHVVYDTESSTTELIVVDVDDGDSPISYEQMIKIYTKLGFEQLGKIENDENVEFREFCFPNEPLNDMNKLFNNAIRISNEKLKVITFLSSVSLFALGFILAKLFF